MILAPGTPIGKYVVRRRLAEGGMAEIYLASFRGPEGFEKEVVIKRIRSFLASDPQFVDMFKAEARHAAKLNHANIVQIFDFGVHEDSWYIAMEYVRGRSLWDLNKRSRQVLSAVPPTLVAHIGSDVARGLHYAHRLKEGGQPLHLVHRDVTPHNVLLSFEGAVKLTDFGIAKAGNRLTSPGMLKGKFAYMSPEQARGDEVDARTDVFALGIVLWEMLTGGRLFVGDSDVATLRAVQHSVIVPPARLNPAVRPELDAVVMRALERDPVRRYQTAQELERALRECVLRHAQSVDETDVGRFLRQVFAPDAAGVDGERAVDPSAGGPQPPSAPESGPAPTPASESERRGAQTVALTERPAAVAGAPRGKITVPMRVPRPAATVTSTAIPPTVVATPTAPSRRSRVRIFAGAGAGVAVLVAGTILISLQPSSAGSPSARVATSVPMPPGSADTAPKSSAHSTPEASDTPPPVEGEGVAPPDAPRPVADGDRGGMATLTVDVRPFAEVVIDGTRKGEVVGKRQWTLPPGRYVVEFRHPKRNSGQQVVTLDEGSQKTVRFNAFTP
ncbi:MAG TPA: protein kinase [Myxococcaceae bacterium]|nr:protein kinase [Myxococcaceae bacterium]